MKEKTFQNIFGKRNKEEGFFELKLTKMKSIAFNKVRSSQIAFLKAVNSDKGAYYKISDYGGFNSGKKAVDCFLVKNTNAYVVVMFYEPRKKKNVYYVFIEDWLKAEKKSEKKSITEKELKRYSCLEANYLDKKQT